MYSHPSFPIKVGLAIEFAPPEAVIRPGDDWPFADHEWVFQVDGGDAGIGWLDVRDQDSAIALAEHKFFTEFNSQVLELLCTAVQNGDTAFATAMIDGWRKHIQHPDDKHVWDNLILSDYPAWHAVWLNEGTALLRYKPLDYIFKCESFDEGFSGVRVSQVEPMPSISMDILEAQGLKSAPLLLMAYPVFIVKYICARV